MLTFAYRVVVGLAFYLPLEDFLLKWLPVSDFVYLTLRQVPDLLVLAAASAVLASRVLSGERVRVVGRGVELAFGGLIVVAFVAAWVNGGSPLAAMLNLKALLRYALVLYVLLNVPLSVDRVRNVFRVLAVAIMIQLVVAGIQWVGGIEVAKFFLPQTTGATVGGLDLHFAATWEVEKGRVFGTMGQTVGFAGLMVVGLALWLGTQGRRRSVRYWTGVAVLLLALYLSGSRAGFFTGVLLVIVHQFLTGGVKVSGAVALYGMAVVGVIVALAGVRLTESEVFFVFTDRYVEIAKNQRLGVVLSVLPAFLSDVGLAQMLVGFSGDPSVVEGFLARMFDAPISIVRRVGMVEDVYWGALLLYYGVFGCGMMAYVVGRLGWETIGIRGGEEGGGLPREVATTALLILVAAVPLNLVGRAFEVRQFSFYLWTAVGLALGCAAAHLGNGGRTHEESSEPS